MAKRHTETTGVTHITAYMQTENKTARQVSTRLHLSAAAVSTWLRKGESPKWSVEAIKGITKKDPTRRTLMMVKVPQENMDLVTRFLNTMEGVTHAEISEK